MPKLEKALKAVEDLENKLRENSESFQDKPNQLKFNKELPLERKYFDNVWTSLNEAKGIEAKIVKPSINAFKTLVDKVYEQSNSEEGTPKITIQAGKTIGLKNFIQVKKLLSEQKGAIEAIENSPILLTVSEPPLPEGDGKPSQPEFHKEQNGAVENSDPVIAK